MKLSSSHDSGRSDSRCVIRGPGQNKGISKQTNLHISRVIEKLQINSIILHMEALLYRHKQDLKHDIWIHHSV